MLTIGQLAEQTGIAIPTIRTWEQRFGFPSADRSTSGHRRYDPAQVDAIARVVAARESGLSLGAAIRVATGAPPAASLCALLGAAEPTAPLLELSAREMHAISRAVEDEALAVGGASRIVGAFQLPEHFASAQSRWRELARTASVAVAFGASPADPESSGRASERDGLTCRSIESSSPLRREWTVAVETPVGSACLAGWERPDRDRRTFEARWTLNPRAVAAVIDGALDLVDVGEFRTGVAPTSSVDGLWATSVTARALRYGLGRT